jgi:hypothetical protein
MLRGIAGRTEDIVPVDPFARGPAASEAGVTDTYAWVLHREILVTGERRLGERVWVHNEVLECVPHHTLLAQVWWRAVALEGAVGREEAEDGKLLLDSRCEGREGDRVIELLAGYFEKYGAGAVEEVDDADKQVRWELENVWRRRSAVL